MRPTTDDRRSRGRVQQGALGAALLAAFALACSSNDPKAAAPAVSDAGFDAPFTSTPVTDAADDVAVPDAIAPLVDAEIEAARPPLPYPAPSYVHLRETGLWDDVDSLRLASGVTAFTPTYKLWSDGASKRRWVRLPPGTTIDTSDMDHWVFPVGTKLWKEFSLGGVRLETRLVERYGEGPDDYWFGAFVWTEDGTDAVFTASGQPNINGTAHDAPAQKDCGGCHRGDVGRVLGLSAIQMSRPEDGPTLRDFATAGLLSQPPPAGVDYPVPGDAPTAAALGYLHANCGHCHNENGTSWPDTQMVLRLTIKDRDAGSSSMVQSLVQKPLQYWRGGAITLRVSPGAPGMSAIVARMSARGNNDQMPSLATEVVDPDGLSAVKGWITGL